MYKNQLQELAQRSCFNLPCYACIREGPDHAPRFKASVNFNGEIFESPTYCTTLRQAEHSAAEVALNVLSTRGPSRSLTARVLDETGVYKNLLQETAHRAGLNLPAYTTVRSGPGHVPVFTSTVELAGMIFTGESAKTKKQAEKNAAIAAWSALKTMPNLDLLSKTSKELDNCEEQDQAIMASVVSNIRHPRDQIKAMRRDQSQMKRRMMRGHRGDNSASLLYQKWRPMDLLMDLLVSEGPIQKHNSSFVSLLPPPPPRTVSKILPPTSSPIQVMPTKSQVNMQEVPPPPLPLDDEHQRDEDEWLNGSKSDVIKKPPIGCSSSNVGYYGSNSIYRPSSSSSVTDHGNQNEHTHIRTRLVGPPQPQCSSQVGRRSIYSTGGYQPHRIAPAVQMRSVIPVCASPPMRHHHPPPPPLAKEIAASSSASATSMQPTANKGAEVLTASPKFSSEFDKKLQL